MSTYASPAQLYGNAAPVLPQPTGLLRPWPQRLKRVLDIAGALLLSLVALPFALLIASAIIFESPGPILFAHIRIGRNGRRFRLWKFRSMVDDAGEVLERYLALNPAYAIEWNLTHKLRNDPRITRVGRFLRRSSLDELPQLWNVLRGDMSLIGPRPIVEQELAKYGPAFALYSQVLPGLTGLWQVSGRNNISYHERVQLDSHYIRAWTLAIDLRVLLKTVRVVLAGHGAY
jgi:Undecaprenyl-phosphate galactose phosphotransferase WbaP